MEFNLGIFLAQLVNFTIIFFVFKKLIWDKIFQAIQERRSKIEKLENADEEYAKILAEAHKNADSAIKEWLQRKEEIISEAILVAKKREEDILALAEKQAMRIQDDAQQKAANLEKELKDGFIDGVRKTTKLVVNKLIKSDVDLQNTYIDWLVHEFVDGK